MDSKEIIKSYGLKLTRRCNCEGFLTEVFTNKEKTIAVSLRVNVNKYYVRRDGVTVRGWSSTNDLNQFLNELMVPASQEEA